MDTHSKRPQVWFDKSAIRVRLDVSNLEVELWYVEGALTLMGRVRGSLDLPGKRPLRSPIRESEN